MSVRAIALSALLILGGFGIPLAAQQTTASAPDDIDVSKLPLNMARLQTKLQASVQREEQSGGTHIRYNIDVFGTAPRLKLLGPEDNLRDGPVPYGAPTHRDMMNYATPKEFSAPVMDFGNLMKWIQSKVGSKS
jgi:hypothetical protein